MEKIIKIADKEVKFRFTMSAFYIFKNQFDYDAMTQVVPALGQIMASIDLSVFDDKKAKNADFVRMLGSALEKTYGFEMVDVLKIIWAFAKAGDETIGTPINFYNQFETFPVIDVLREMLPSLLEALGSKKKLTEITNMKKVQKTVKKS